MHSIPHISHLFLHLPSSTFALLIKNFHFPRSSNFLFLSDNFIMTVDIMRFPKMEDQTAIQEAASQGLKSMEHLIRVISNRPEDHNVDCSEITDFTVSKFKKVISLLNRTGHARFRRGPVQSSPSSSSSSDASPPPPPPVSQPTPPTQLSPVTPVSFVQSHQQSLTLDFTRPSVFGAKTKSTEIVEFAKESFSVSSNSSFMSSAITGDGSVSKGSSIFFPPAPTAPVASSGKPPLAGLPYRKRCFEHDHSQNFSGKISGSVSGKCHCKKRYCYETLVIKLKSGLILS